MNHIKIDWGKRSGRGVLTFKPLLFDNDNESTQSETIRILVEADEGRGND